LLRLLNGRRHHAVDLRLHGIEQIVRVGDLEQLPNRIIAGRRVVRARESGQQQPCDETEISISHGWIPYCAGDRSADFAPASAFVPG
jgi:hypothetical protein